jgi:hypothetical protein
MKQLLWVRSVALSLVTGALLINCAAAQRLSDNFTLWTANSPFLNNLAAATSSPSGTFIAPQTTFTGTTGLQMSGLSQDFTLTGLQSLTTFSAPLTTTLEVTPIQGTANPFAIYLVSADLTQYLTLHANVDPVYEGFWVNAPNVNELYNLGQQFSPNFEPQMNTLYKLVMQINSLGVGTVKIYSGEKLLGTFKNLQAGTGPFYLVVGQRIGLPEQTGPQVADWSSVTVAVSASFFE